MYLGIKAVVVKTFARIHRENLINFGILPLTLVNPSDYDKLKQDDELEIPNVRKALEKGETTVFVVNKRTGEKIEARHDLTQRQIEIMLAGGMLNYIREKS